MTWSDLRSTAAARLGSAMEVRWLIEEVTGDQRPTGQPTPGSIARFEALVGRRAAGEPLQYVLGRWSFRTLDLMVDRRVLIPRSETEQVVEVALRQLDQLDELDRSRTRPSTRSSTPPRTPPSTSPSTPPTTPPTTPPHRTAVDLGTGSGAIALSLAAERPGLEVWATDASRDAIAVASANLAGVGGHAAARVRIVHGHWWSALPPHLEGRIDLLVSNPPYIATGEMSHLDAEVANHEPKAALEAGPTGLEAIDEILDGAGPWLRPGAAVVLEIAPHQADAAAAIATTSGFTAVSIHPDLAGRDRVLVATKPSAPGPRP